MRRFTTQALAVASSAALLVACSSGRDSGEEGGSTGTADLPAAAGTFTVGVANDPGNLDPSMTVLSVTRTVSRLGYDSLVYQDDDGEFLSGLASEWEVTDDSIEFTLQEGVTCSDGSALSATDVKDNIDYVSDPENQSPLLGVFVPPGLTTEADDEAGTVTVTAPDPNPFLLHGFTGVFMICRAGLDDHSLLAQDMIGTGPYQLTEAVADDRYTFTPRADYTWGPGGATMDEPGVPDELQVRVIANPTTLANLVLSGEVNSATVLGTEGERLLGEGIERIELRSPLGELFFNQDEGRPGSDPAVRAALMQGLDTPTLSQIATGGQGAESEGLVTSSPNPCPGDTVSGSLPTFDAAAAAAALDAAGWTSGDGGTRTKDGTPLTVTFIYPAEGGDGVAAAAELVSQQWTEIGVDVTLQSVTSTQLNDVIFASGSWDAGWVPITVSLPTQLVAFLSGPAAPDGTNFAHIDNTVYNDSSAQAQATGDLQEACDLWITGEQSLIAEADVVPMFDTITGIYTNGGTVRYLSGELDGTSPRLGQ